LREKAELFFDLIVGFENGIVKEIGTHDELMELKGIYHQLCTSQTKENKNENDDIIIDNNSKYNESSSSSDSESETEIKKESVVDENQRRVSRAVSKKSINSEKASRKKEFLKYEKKLLKFSLFPFWSI
jgi:ATP-binding cassette subfamily B (MDR/TAP) protein 1